MLKRGMLSLAIVFTAMAGVALQASTAKADVTIVGWTSKGHRWLGPFL